MGFCSPMNLASARLFWTSMHCDPHSDYLSVAGKGERWYIQGQQEGDAGFLLLTDFLAIADSYSSPRCVMLHTGKMWF